MLGLLALTADSPEGLLLDSPIFGQGVTPNELIITGGSANFGFPVTVNIKEVESDVSLTLNMQTDQADATVTCP